MSHNGDKLATILGNPAPIEAYKAGIPGNGKPFPTAVGSRRFIGRAKTDENQPGEPTVPGALHDVDFMVKDIKKFAEQRRMGIRAVRLRPRDGDVQARPTENLPPQEHDAKCGFACYMIVADKDYVFTAYPKR